MSDYPNPLRIFIVARGYPTEESPLNGIFELDQARALADIGHRVTLLAIDLRSFRHKRPLGFRLTKIGAVRILAYSVPLGRVPAKLEKLVGTACARYLFAKAKELFGKPDVIHSHFALQGLYVKKLDLDASTITAYTEHCSFVIKGHRRYCRMMKEACEKTDLAIAVSSSLAKKMEPWIHRQANVIWNIADTDVFNQKCQRHHNGFNIVSVGSLNLGKNHALLIRAFSKAKSQTNTMMHLAIYGEGPERGNLEALISDLGIVGSVSLMGQCPRDEIVRGFSSADCFALASSFETFGVAYIEAMAAGLPIIATKCGGPEDFIQPFCGVLVPADNEDAFAGALIEMTATYKQYDSNSIKAYVHDNFSGQAIAKKLESHYLNLLENRL